MQQDIVGIDISHSYVRTIGLKKKNKKWSLHKISTKELDESNENDEKKNSYLYQGTNKHLGCFLAQ